MMKTPMLAYRLPYGKFLRREWETLEFMREAGINLVCISPMNTVNSVGDPYSDYPLIWKWDEVYDFGVLDRQIEEALAHHPAARFLVTVDLNTPLWLARRLSLDSFYRLTDCILHPQWKPLTDAYLIAFLDHCERKWGDRIEGYIIACGRTLEWIECRNFEPSVRKNIAFRSWCRERNLPQYPVPLIDGTEKRLHESVYDPAKEAEFPAWLRFLNELTADLVISFISTARKHIRTSAKIGIFYAHIRNIGIGGQLDCERVLDTAPPDFVIGAACNRPADIGCNSGYIGVTEMLRRRNIGFMFECDRITSEANLKMSEFVTLSGGIWEGWKTEADDIAGLKRELGMALVNRLSFWFFNIWGGMYRSAGTRALIRRAAEVWKKYTQLSTGSAAQILLVIDPESNYFLHSWKEIDRYTSLENRISAAGLPADTATVSDLETMELSQYKVVIFQNLAVMNSRKEALLKNKICKNCRTVILLNTPGIVWDGVYAEAGMELLAGSVSPEAVAVRKLTEWTLVHARNADLLTEERIRELAKAAGVFFCSEDAAFHCSRELLVVHSKSGGELLVRLPFRAKRGVEIFDDRVAAVETDRFTDRFSSPGTNIYYLEH